jgi:ABC-2 type transport system ATP-binding protein
MALELVKNPPSASGSATETDAASTPAAAGASTSAGLPLRIEHLTKRYGHRTVVDDLSFTAEPGRVTGFLGPNGSGKSTTMKILLDLASADGGTATIGGHRYRDLPDPPAAVGVLLESNAFHPGRSGVNHLRILADAHGVAHERVGVVLDMVGLGDAAERRVGGYSLGMRQRLGLAAALLGDPPVLVLDEPTNGLDPQGMRTMRQLLRARAAQGQTVFVSSHLLDEVEHLADDVVVLSRGRLVVTGPLRDLQHAATLVRSSSVAALVPVLEEAGATVGDLAFHSGIALHELATHSGSLEERFLVWTGDGSDTNEEAIRQ